MAVVSQGCCAENTSKVQNIGREEQDTFAVESYKRSAAATEAGVFKSEIIPVTVSPGRGKPDIIVEEDEEFRKVKFDKVSVCCLNVFSIHSAGC